MELFRLHGVVDVATDKAENSLSNFSSSAAKVGKVVAAGLVAAKTAIVTLTTKSIQAYAEYEQLVGGVETLFGTRGAKTVEEYAALVGKSVDSVSAEFDMLQKAQDKVLKDSKTAYKEAGMSANAYMDTVNSVAAALNASSSSQLESAELAKLAVVDMADNANKMGSSMEAIQTAYQGFAKQNFTMLDNLKLGYGGTGEEMKRLLKDAQAISGIEYDISSYADVVSAIHVIQEEMGIAGATADEASKTISGSLSAMKASWENLITAMADDEADFGEYVTSFVDSVGIVAENLIPRISIALDGIVMLIEQLAPVIISKIPGLIQSFLPSLTAATLSLLISLAQILPELAVGLVQQIPVIIGEIRSALEAAFPELEEPFAVVEELFNGIWQAMQIVWQEIGKPIFDAVAEAFRTTRNALQPFIDAFNDYVIEGRFAADATAVITAAVDGLKTAYEVVAGFITGVVDGFKSAVEWGREHETALTLIAVAVGTLTAAIGAYNIAAAIKNAGGVAEIAQLGILQVQIWGLQIAEVAHTAASWLATAATTAFGAAMAFLTSPITLVVLAIGALIAIVVLCVKHWDDIKEAGAKAWEWIKEAWSKAGEWFANIWNSIKNAFANVGSWFSEKFSAAKAGVQNAWSSVTGFFSNIKEKIVNAFANVKEKMSQPFEKARDAIKSVVDKVKGFFSGLKLKFPSIPLPHFSIKPAGWKIGDLLEGSIPRLGIDWYAKAMENPIIMNKPTIFGYDGATGQLMGGGEAGSEVVAGTNTLMNMIQTAVMNQNNALAGILLQILDAILALDANMGGNLREALEGTAFEVNKREFARLVKAVN